MLKLFLSCVVVLKEKRQLTKWKIEINDDSLKGKSEKLEENRKKIRKAQKELFLVFLNM